MPIVVKRRGYKEKFDEKKVYGSIYYACRSAQLNEKESEEISEKVIKDLKKWLKGKKEITSQEIFITVITILEKYNSDVAFLYETHRDLS